MSLCSANDISAICSIPTKNITTKLGRTYRCTRTRQSHVLSRPSVARWRCQFWAGCITNISGRKFPTGTGLEKFRASVLPNQNVIAVVIAVSFLACTHGAHVGRQGGHNNLAYGVHEWISRRQSPSGKTATPSFLINVRSARPSKQDYDLLPEGRWYLFG